MLHHDAADVSQVGVVELVRFVRCLHALGCVVTLRPEVEHPPVAVFHLPVDARHHGTGAVADAGDTLAAAALNCVGHAVSVRIGAGFAQVGIGVPAAAAALSRETVFLTEAAEAVTISLADIAASASRHAASLRSARNHPNAIRAGHHPERITPARARVPAATAARLEDVPAHIERNVHLHRPAGTRLLPEEIRSHLALEVARGWVGNVRGCRGPAPPAGGHTLGDREAVLAVPVPAGRLTIVSQHGSARIGRMVIRRHRIAAALTVCPPVGAACRPALGGINALTINVDVSTAAPGRQCEVNPRIGDVATACLEQRGVKYSGVALSVSELNANDVAADCAAGRPVVCAVREAA